MRICVGVGMRSRLMHGRGGTYVLMAGATICRGQTSDALYVVMCRAELYTHPFECVCFHLS